METLLTTNGLDFMVILFAILFIFFRLLATVVKQICRSYRISKQGWPPAHLNADGDSIIS